MVRLTVFFTVIAVSIVLDRVDSLQNANVQNFLQALQQQLKLEQEQDLQRKSQRHEYYEKDQDDSYYGSLNKRDIDQLINLSPRNQKRSYSSRNRLGNKKRDEQLVLLNRQDALSRFDPDSSSSSESKEVVGDKTLRENEYSKVYVILNSDAIKRSKNKDKLSALLSNLLTSLPGQNRDQQNHHSHRASHRHGQRGRSQDLLDRYHNKRQRYQERDNRYDVIWQPDRQDRFQNKRDRYQYDNDRYQDNYARYQDQEDGSRDLLRYKGFLLNSDWLRRKMPRGSNEMYGKDNDRTETRPKPMAMRPRDIPREKPRRGRDRGGGGGGGVGHTAIPYIRQHGDIYEREN